MIQRKIIFIHFSGFDIILFKFLKGIKLQQPPFPFHNICHYAQYVAWTLQQLLLTNNKSRTL